MKEILIVKGYVNENNLISFFNDFFINVFDIEKLSFEKDVNKKVFFTIVVKNNDLPSNLKWLEHLNKIMNITHIENLQK